MNTLNNIKEGKYDNKMEYPIKETYKCVCGVGYTEKSDHKFCKECGAQIEDSRKQHYEQFKKDRIKYNEESSILRNQFRDDLFEEYGVGDNPKKDQCYNLAWEYGHSSGLHEVINHFDRLVELII